MPTPPRIKYASVDELRLDPTNPRLGRRIASPKLSQEKVLDIMSDWTLEELAESFLSNGFWPQEALIAVKENLYGESSLVVVEGNRRLAALKYLERAVEGDHASKRWANLIAGRKVPKELFESVPYILMSNREKVATYLGFRHVTGIKEWNPAEKAEYIAKLIEGHDLSYEDVRRQIGSKTPTVRQHYISYRLLLQMEQNEDVSIEAVEEKFSVLYLSLRTQGAQSYLHIDIQASPSKAKNPVPKAHLKNLTNFAGWLFGDEKHPPLFTDSRNVDNFGKVLESTQAVEYLERTTNPRFELACRKAGVGEDDIVDLISGASDNIQLALTDAFSFRKSLSVQKVVRRLGTDVTALLNIFPAVKKEVLEEMQEDAGTA
jgi:hypothetical protein